MPRGSSPGSVTGEIKVTLADAVLLCTGGYGNVFYLSTNARGCNVTATCAPTNAEPFANPCYTQIHPTCIPVAGDYQSKLTLMSESLRNDGRVWVPKRKETTAPAGNPRGGDATIISKGNTRATATSPRDISSRSAKEACDDGRGVGSRRPRRLPRFLRCHQTPRPSCHRGTLRQPLRDVREHHRVRTPTNVRCASIPPSTTRWGALGGLQPDE